MPPPSPFSQKMGENTYTQPRTTRKTSNAEANEESRNARRTSKATPKESNEPASVEAIGRSEASLLSLHSSSSSSEESQGGDCVEPLGEVSDWYNPGNNEPVMSGALNPPTVPPSMEGDPPPDTGEESHLPVISPLPRSGVSNPDETRPLIVNYPELLEGGCLTVVCSKAYKHARGRHYSVAENMDEGTWRGLSVPLLVSIRPIVLKELISGNLAAAYRTREDPEIREQYHEDSEWQKRGRVDAPCVYARILCDIQTGLSPTPWQWLRVIKRLREYIDGNASEQLAWRVVEIEIAGGFDVEKRQAAGGDRVFIGSFRSITQVVRFCDALETTIMTMGRGEWDTPMPHAFHFIGCALVFADRHSHLGPDNSSSSWFMNLVKAVMKAELNDTDSLWEFDDYVVCYCTYEEEVPVAELLFTMISLADSHTGTGFVVHPPGENVVSSQLDSRLGRDVKKLWTECMDRREACEIFTEGAERELQAIAAYPSREKSRRAREAREMAEKVGMARQKHVDLVKKKNGIRLKLIHDAEKRKALVDTMRDILPPGILGCFEVQEAKMKQWQEVLGPVERIDGEPEPLLPSSEDDQMEGVEKESQAIASDNKRIETLDQERRAAVPTTEKNETRRRLLKNPFGPVEGIDGESEPLLPRSEDDDMEESDM
ncbi:hypothetical protein CC80DRAFT_562036 [Byssothecium circinans]|uniref:Uncharacterized protein n=1 Tax=Byssothecium circinans TaxID=147558 RepID=A0A6A5TXR4_9PLEO|nr:hypothetical protein CC80DRAFT_562036 [Byssothecium circinans]